MRLVEAAESELLLKNQVHWFKLLQAENDNIRAVIDWGAESEFSIYALSDEDSANEKSRIESALRLVGALLWFWFSYGSTSEGRDLALKALSSPSGVQFKAVRARALNTAGLLVYLLGDTVLARQLLEEALSIQNTLARKPVMPGRCSSWGWF